MNQFEQYQPQLHQQDITAIRQSGITITDHANRHQKMHQTDFTT